MGIIDLALRKETCAGHTDKGVVSKYAEAVAME
jgi:hypothetical protein